jgi:hypothetical protein
MVHSAPDWSSLRTAIAYPRRQDLAELAVRLGSIVSFDRRGDVVLWDDFESGLSRWSANLSGSGAAVYLSSARARSGLFSVLLLAGTDLSRYAAISVAIHVSVAAYCGWEISVQPGSAYETLQWELTIYAGGLMLQYVVQLDRAAQELRLRDHTGAFVTFATDVDTTYYAGLWTPAKLVADPQGRSYLRFLWGSSAWDLSSYSAQATAAVGIDRILATVRLTGRAGAGDYAYVDDAIVTVNEPL